MKNKTIDGFTYYKSQKTMSEKQQWLFMTIITITFIALQYISGHFISLH